MCISMYNYEAYLGDIGDIVSLDLYLLEVDRKVKVLNDSL